MKATTLERPRKTEAKETPPRCQTPFLEKNRDNRSVLGNPRWSTIPAIPQRERVWEVVRPSERYEAARILESYRRNEAICAENDVVGKTALARDLEASRDGAEIVRAKGVRAEIIACDHDKFLAAQAELRRLIDEATKLVVPCLLRCIDSFDAELNDLALNREADMTKLGIPLFQEVMPGGTKTYIDGNFAGRMSLVWELWNSRECNALHSCREICRLLWQKFTLGEGEHVSAWETRSTRAIPSLTYLFTDEDVASFSWL